MGQFHFTPDDYLQLMHEEVPSYDELQQRIAQATEGLPARNVLDLGAGTGQTALRVLAKHPGARLTGVDVSAEMLAEAERALPAGTVDALLVQRLEDTLPDGPFDLVVSALAIHHLDGPGKADLFRRIAERLETGGRFVMGDVIVPTDPSDATTPLTPGYDMPSSIPELHGWLTEAGFDAKVVWRKKDLALFRSELR